jgi:histidinol-phosphate aminotransferase
MNPKGALTPRPGILEIEPYVGGESRIEGGARIIKLSSNEGALGPSPSAVAAYREAAAELRRYPDGGCTGLRAAIGERFGLSPERIVCGAGSDELLTLLARAYCGPGDEVLHSEHGFLMYPIIARSVGARPIAVPERALTADVDALLGAVTGKTRIVYLANPNNPTGSYLGIDELGRLRSGLPDGVLLVIDAAYSEYVTRNDYAPGIELVDGGDNVVMTRTFSKIFAMGGLRLGWAYAPPATVGLLNRLRMPFNVTGPTQAAGVAALGDGAFADEARAHNEKWRAFLAEALGAIGLKVHPSVANFVLVEFPAEAGCDAAAADAYLKTHGIITRRVDNYGLPACLRITIGLEHEMKATADALKEFMG